MDFGPSDSSGTDDDLPPSHQNRGTKGGRPPGNGRTIVGALQYPRVQNDMETQIHLLEQEAYSSVLRAFKAQSDALTWDKESLITELRKELRVSDEEHRELLNRVNADDIIRRIREWRQAGGSLLNNAQPAHDPVPSPTVSASRKRQKTSQAIPSLPYGTSSSLHPQSVAPSIQPSSSAKKSGTAGAKAKKPKHGQTLPGTSGRGQIVNKIEQAGAPPFNQMIGRKVMTRWPEDSNFYEAVITDYNPIKGLHALVYDLNTEDETWEWVNLKEISPDDIRWEGEDLGTSFRVGPGGPGRGLKNSTGRGGATPGAGRGRGGVKNQPKKDFPPVQNGLGKKNPNEIEILHTDTLLKEVERRVFASSQPDPLELEKTKKVLKDQEQSLLEVIQRLADALDDESDGDHQYSHGQSMDPDHGRRNRHYGGNQQDLGMGSEGREGFDGEHMAEGGGASDYRLVGDGDNN